MLTISFWLLAATVAFGTVLLLLYLRGKGLPHRAIAPAHGVLGGVSVAVLIVALSGSAVRGAKYGVSSFGTFAEVLAALAFVFGLALFFLKRRRAANLDLVLAVHAILAAMAFVILFAYVRLGA